MGCIWAVNTDGKQTDKANDMQTIARKTAERPAEKPAINGHGPEMAAARRLEALDDIIHQKVRLGVMSSLMASGEADFNFPQARARRL